MSLRPFNFFQKAILQYHIWLIGVSFVLFQFFLQLSSGVIISSIREDMHYSALQAGFLGSAFYYVYTSMQIPVGLLFDRRNTRILLSTTAFLCGLGCLCFAQSYQFHSLILGRILIGAGASFAFVGLSHLLRQYYPLKQFGFMMGLTETLGFLMAMFGIIGIGALVAQWGWRNFINAAAFMGFGIGLLCWRNLPNSSSLPPSTKPKQQLFAILSNGRAWINGLFVGLSFMVITVLGGMWAIPFIQVKLGCSLKDASFLGSMIFLGAAVSCPMFAILGSLFSKRRPLMISSCLSTALIVLIFIYYPTKSHFLVGFLMFSTGLCCGAYMFAFSIANELASSDSLSTCTGFTNTLGMITAPIFQPLVGFMLDNYYHSHPGNILIAYQHALLLVPCSLVMASILVCWLPEKDGK